MEKSVNYL